MTFRGIYRDGVIVPNSEPGLSNGTVVRCTPAAKPQRKAPVKTAAQTRKKSGSRAEKTRRMTKPQRVAAVMQAFGMYRDRPDWRGRSSIEIAAELRQNALGSAMRPY